jgi:hypothetical protein
VSGKSGEGGEKVEKASKKCSKPILLRQKNFEKRLENGHGGEIQFL